MDRAVITAIEKLANLNVAELKIHYIQVFGEACKSTNKDFLLRRMAFRLQANAAGDLTGPSVRP